MYSIDHHNRRFSISKSWALFVIIFLFIALSGFGQSNKIPDGFAPLFNGKDFTGWEGPLDSFRIESGAIVGGQLENRIPHNQFLATKKSYNDFKDIDRKLFEIEVNIFNQNDLYTCCWAFVWTNILLDTSGCRLE